MQEERLTGDLMHVLGPEDRLWHSGEVGELIDHPAEIAHLTYDRPGEPFESLRIGRDFLAEAPLEAFGSQLDWGQRVLDFVRDSAGDIRPGSAALVRQLICDVIESNDRTLMITDAFYGKRALSGT